MVGTRGESGELVEVEVPTALAQFLDCFHEVNDAGSPQQGAEHVFLPP